MRYATSMHLARNPVGDGGGGEAIPENDITVGFFSRVRSGARLRGYDARAELGAIERPLPKEAQWCSL